LLFNQWKCRDTELTCTKVRAGYHIGEVLFKVTPDEAKLKGDDVYDRPAAVCHIIGERPGSGHHTFSAYLTVATRRTWSATRAVDHDITKVVSGIADTSFDPVKAAISSAKIISDLASDLSADEARPISPANSTFSRPSKMPRIATPAIVEGEE